VTDSKDQTCYQAVQENNSACTQTECRHYLSSEGDLNCSILAAKNGPKTLQEIGDYYGISRMRVCQIEKSILKKLRLGSKDLGLFDPSPGE
jgi:DNA-binding CsgD family transcriptional regulator